MATVAEKWEELRKEARRLENEIDWKLVTFCRLTADLSSSGSCRSAADSDEQQLHSPDSVESDLEQLISELTDVNSQMTEVISSASSPTAAASATAAGDTTLLHTGRRHGDLLRDYLCEFQRTRHQLHTARTRHQLLGTNTGSASDTSANGVSQRGDSLLKEHEHIRNSDRLIDEQIAIAMETRKLLAGQRSTFSNMQGRLSELGHRFPVINSVLHRIQLRKRRDTLVLALVVSLCLIFFIWFVFG